MDSDTIFRGIPACELEAHWPTQFYSLLQFIRCSKIRKGCPDDFISITVSDCYVVLHQFGDISHWNTSVALLNATFRGTCQPVTSRESVKVRPPLYRNPRCSTCRSPVV